MHQRTRPSLDGEAGVAPPASSWSSSCDGSRPGVSARESKAPQSSKLSVVQFGLVSVQQQVPIRLTACHLGGVRPWFVCSVYSDGRYCGRRAAILYCAGELFACRQCYGLSYASQQQTAVRRGLDKGRKIRMRLGGDADLLAAFPQRPKGMHQRTFQRLRARAEAAAFGRRGLGG